MVGCGVKLTIIYSYHFLRPSLKHTKIQYENNLLMLIVVCVGVLSEWRSVYEYGSGYSNQNWVQQEDSMEPLAQKHALHSCLLFMKARPGMIFKFRTQLAHVLFSMFLMTRSNYSRLRWRMKNVSDVRNSFGILARQLLQAILHKHET